MNRLKFYGKLYRRLKGCQIHGYVNQSILLLFKERIVYFQPWICLMILFIWSGYGCRAMTMVCVNAGFFYLFSNEDTFPIKSLILFLIS